MAKHEFQQNGGSASRWSEQGRSTPASYDEPGKISQCIQDRPDEAVLVALVSGVAVGVVIGMAIAGSDQPQRWRDRRLAESLGQRLMTSLDRVLPESLSQNLGLHR